MKIESIVSQIYSKSKCLQLGTNLTISKLIFYKHIENDESVFRRSGKDDIHSSSCKTTYSYVNFSEYKISEELQDRIEKSLKTLMDYESSSTHYYGGGNNSSSSQTQVLLEESRKINFEIGKHNSAEIITEHRIKRILYYFLQNLDQSKNQNNCNIYQYHFLLKESEKSIKALLFLLFCKHSQNNKYAELLLKNEQFWDLFIKYFDSKMTQEFITELVNLYNDNSNLIDEFIYNNFDEIDFTRKINSLIVSSNNNLALYNFQTIFNNFKSYFN